MVDHCQDMNEIIANREEDAIRKPREQRATDAGDYFGVWERCLLKALEL